MDGFVSMRHTVLGSLSHRGETLRACEMLSYSLESGECSLILEGMFKVTNLSEFCYQSHEQGKPLFRISICLIEPSALSDPSRVSVFVPKTIFAAERQDYKHVIFSDLLCFTDRITVSALDFCAL